MDPSTCTLGCAPCGGISTEATAGHATSLIHLTDLIADEFGTSRSEARRLIAQGAVRLDEKPLDAMSMDIATSELSGKTLTVGKRRSVQL